MARTDNRERERWPEAQPEEYEAETGAIGRWPDTDPNDRWPEVEPPTRRAPRAGRLRVEVPPIVNPYAIVALVAALLGLFPVAIVFGFIAFSHPRGKTMAVCALLLGVIEVVGIAGYVVLSGGNFSDALSGMNRTPVVSSVALPSTISQTAVVQPSVAPTVITPPPTSTSQVTPKKGTVCTEPGRIGTGADGTTLLCLASGGVYQWNGPYTVGGTVAEPGTKCDGSSKSARTADGRAVTCESKVWVLWTE
ncbi:MULTISPECIES: DUF4190 domain-containing protein [unclassified Nocardia]|uniref:DUF4190 domain-containing protein n=1 Tax=unclassified Nocardia TaxID=2637762 RepID=UPI00342628FC